MRGQETVPQLWLKWQAWLWPAIILAGSVFVALIVHSVLFAIAKRVTKRTGGPIENSLVRHAEGPTRWIFACWQLFSPSRPYPSVMNWCRSFGMWSASVRLLR